MPAKKNNVFYSWIGFKDLNYVASLLEDDDFSNRLETLKKSHPGVSQTSPYSPMLNAIAKKSVGFWKRIYLFCDLEDTEVQEKYRRFIEEKYKVEVILKHIEVDDTHAYQAIYQQTFKHWKDLPETYSNTIPYFSLASGTSAMKALFLILGALFYPDTAQYFESKNKNGSQDSGIGDPFKISDLSQTVLGGVIQGLEEALQAFDPIIGESEGIRKAKSMAAKAALTDFNVLIFGESGTGKELFAKGIHNAGERKQKKFYALNCAALPANLLESTLFGYVKGAFTGADKNKEGILKECDGGTLFLDEIEACPPEIQAKLLRVLQPSKDERITCRKFQPLGTTKEESSDVRIIAATNIKLNEIKDFRMDLLNRVATLSISLPALRDRKDDLANLARNLFEEIKKKSPAAFQRKTLDNNAINFIVSQAWPGNVRQLQNVLTQAIVFSDSKQITASDLQTFLPSDAQQDTCEKVMIEQDSELCDLPLNLQERIENSTCGLKVRYIQAALKQSEGVKTQAAVMLGISYQTMDNWINSLKKRGYTIDV